MATQKFECFFNEALQLSSLSVCQSGWQIAKPHHAYGPEIRNYYVIHYIISGRGRYEVGGVSYPLKRGDGFLIMPGDSTYYVADHLDPWEYYWVGFHGYEAERILSLCGLTRDHPVFTYTQDDLLARHIKDIFYASRNYKAWEYAMIGYLLLLLSCMIHSTEAVKPFHQHYLSKAVEYINQNYMHPVTVEQIAGIVGIDRTYLYRIFQKALGVSVKEYIDKLRQEKARELLSTTNSSIASICSAVGYGSSARFSKKFRSIYGITPSEYRTSAKEATNRHE